MEVLGHGLLHPLFIDLPTTFTTSISLKLRHRLPLPLLLATARADDIPFRSQLSVHPDSFPSPSPSFLPRKQPLSPSPPAPKSSLQATPLVSSSASSSSSSSSTPSSSFLSRLTSLSLSVHPASLSAPSIPHLHIDLSSSACSDEPEGMEQQESDHERRQGSIDFAGEVSAHKQKERLPLGQRRYRTTVILRPDITEKERLDWTQRYNEAITAGGVVNVEFMNRGLLPLTYSIKKKDLGGLSQTYLDGVLMHISYTTKPERQLDLQKKLNADDNVIRTITVLLK